MPLAVDNTILTAVQTCELKAGIRHVLGLTAGEERRELTAGSAVHESLAVWHRTGNKDEALTLFDKVYKPVAGALHAEERLSHYNVRRILQRYYHVYQTTPPPYTPQKDLVEVTFEAPLDTQGDYVLIGRLDAVAAYKGRLVVLECKTTGGLNDFWRSRWPMSSQLTTYVYGATHGQVGGAPLQLPIEEAVVFGLELRKLPGSNSRCAEHKLPYAECGDLHAKWELAGPYPRPAELVERWREDAVRAAQRFQWMQEHVIGESLEHGLQLCKDNLYQQGQFNGACGYCEFQDYCRQSLPVKMMAGNLQYNPWDQRDVDHLGKPSLIQIDRSATKEPAYVGVDTIGEAPQPINRRG